MLRHTSICAVIALSLAAFMPAYCFAESEADLAAQALAAKNIPADNESFISEISEGHTDNVKLFLTLGAQAGTQNRIGTSALMAALKSKNPDVLNLILSTIPADASAAEVVNLKDKLGNTALIKAVMTDDEAAVDLLLARGADVSITSSAQATPLIIAVQQKNEATLKKLLEADAKAAKPGATLELEDSKGNKALVYAISEQVPALVKLLLDAHANAVQPDSIGVTPLMLAAEKGDESIGQMLIDAGAKIGATTKSGDTPISIAIRHAHSKLAKLMIEKSPPTDMLNYTSALTAALEADPIDAEFFAYLLEHTNKTEALPTSLLFTALDRKNHDVIKLLLARKPDVKAVNADNETLFYHAIDSGFEDIALELMAMGADTTQTGVSGISLLARAVRHNMAKVAATLIEKGASPDQKTPEGYSLAEMCVYSGYPETLAVLIAHGVKLEKEFALLWSIRDGKGKVVPLLLGQGATTNIMNQDGIPAISLAAEAGEVEAVKGFIDHKASLDYPSKVQNTTALAVAAHAGHLEIVKMLVEAGANIEALDNYGMTPLAHAAVTSKADVVEYLLGKGANAKAVDGQKRSLSDIASHAAASPERDKILQMLTAAAGKPAAK